MAVTEKSNATELVAGFSQEAAHARRQWANWLGVGSGGGVVALLSFAANLPNPDLALQLLAPAIAAFVLAVAFAATALLTQAEENASAASYYAEEHNSAERRSAANAMPEHIAAPQALADRLNARRNSQLALAEEHRSTAKAEWNRRVIWKWCRRVLMTASATAFVMGASYPLYLIWNDVSLAGQGTTEARQGASPEKSRASEAEVETLDIESRDQVPH